MFDFLNINYSLNDKNAFILIFRCLSNKAKKRYDTFLTEAKRSGVSDGGENLRIFANRNASQQNK